MNAEYHNVITIIKWKLYIGYLFVNWWNLKVNNNTLILSAIKADTTDLSCYDDKA